MLRSTSIVSRGHRALVAIATVVALLAGGIVSTQLTVATANAAPGDECNRSIVAPEARCGGSGGGSLPDLNGATAHSIIEGAYYSYQFAMYGTIADISGLPTGMTLSPNALLSGTPPTGSAGTYPVEVTIYGQGGTTVFVITITITNPLVFAGPGALSAAVNYPFSLQLSAAGNPAPTFSSSTLPTGLSISAQGILSGTPTTVGTSSVTVTASSGGASIARTFDFRVTGTAPSFTSASTTTLVLGTQSSFVVSANGNPSPTLAQRLQLVLPTGVTATTQLDGTITIAGSPSQTGTFTLPFRATNAVGTADQDLVLTVVQAPVPSDPTSVTAVVGANATFSASSTGFPVPSVQWQRAGTDGIWSDVVGAVSPSYVRPVAKSDVGSSYRAVFTNSAGSAATAAASLTVQYAPTVTSTTTVTFVVGDYQEFTVVADAAPAASFTSSGLPEWLHFRDNGDGTAILSGTAPLSAAGSTPSVGVQANNVAGNTSATIVVTVGQKPVVIVAPEGATIVPGGEVTLSASATGSPTPAAQWQRSVGGAAFENLAGATATTLAITGVAELDGAKYRVVFTNVHGTATTANATVRVGLAPQFTSADTVVFQVDVSGAFVVRASGSPVPTLSASTLPSGVTFVDNGDGSATLAGTAGRAAVGENAITITASNGFDPSETQEFTLAVHSAPVFTSSYTAVFAQGGVESFTVGTSSGFPTSTRLTVSGGLPEGTTFVDNNDGTATLAGTPAAGTGGEYPVTITATSVGGVTAARVQSFTLTVNERTTFSSASATRFVLGRASSFTVTTRQGYPATSVLTATGALPAGVTFVDNADGTATIAGTPRSAGVFTVQIASSNGPGGLVGQSLALTVVAPPTIIDSADATFTIGVPKSITIRSTPGFPIATALSIHGSLPDGLTFADNGDGTATIAGAAGPSSVGEFAVTITASNGVGSDASVASTISVVAAPVIPLPATVPSAAGPAVGVPDSSVVGESIVVSGSGYAPGSTVTIGIFSTPRSLGTAIVAADGSFSVRVTLPSDLTGQHTIAVAGLGIDGTARYLTSAISITTLPVAVVPAVLAATGIDVAPTLWLAVLLGLLGVLLVGRARRRRGLRLVS